MTIDEDGANAFPFLIHKMQIIRAAMNVNRIIVTVLELGLRKSNCVSADSIVGILV